MISANSTFGTIGLYSTSLLRRRIVGSTSTGDRLHCNGNRTIELAKVFKDRAFEHSADYIAFDLNRPNSIHSLRKSYSQSDKRPFITADEGPLISEWRRRESNPRPVML